MLKKQQHIQQKRWVLTTLAVGAILAVSQPAFAQSAEETSQKPTTTTDGLNLNLSNTVNAEFDSGFNSGLSGFELPASSVGSSLFKLDISDPSCLSGQTQCLRRDDRINLGVKKQFTSVSKKGLDLSLTPRASMQFNDDNSSALVGAVVEIGEDLREGSDFDNNTWYVFAGADAEALTYSPNSIGRLTSGQFHLQDRIIVGDAQAGVGYRIGDADVSLSYMRREASTDEYSWTEDAAALSFTWKR